MPETVVRDLLVVYVSPKGYEGKTVVRRYLIVDGENTLPTADFWVYGSVRSARANLLGGRAVYDRSELPWKAIPNPTLAEVWL